MAHPFRRVVPHREIAGSDPSHRETRLLPRRSNASGIHIYVFDCRLQVGLGCPVDTSPRHRPAEPLFGHMSVQQQLPVKFCLTMGSGCRSVSGLEICNLEEACVFADQVGSAGQTVIAFVGL